jgi:hypothetical protein
MQRFILVVLSLVAILGLAACGDTTSTQTFRATLNGANERPNPVTTAATGSATVELKGNDMTLTGNFTDLSGAATLAHIHGPADENSTAGPLFNLSFTAATAGTLSFSKTLTDAEVADLKAGKWYVNIHTGNNPGGEIRGQLK